jgi:hypothetical protein
MHGRFDEMIERLRSVVEGDREDFAEYEAGRRSYQGDEDVAEEEKSSLARRIMKNLALIRAYETRNDD